MPQESPMQFKSEGDPAFETKNTEKDNSGESSPEPKETTIDQTGSPDQDKNQAQPQDDDGKPGSYDKKSDLNNPTVERWQEREEDWKNRFNDQERRHVEEVANLTKLVTELGAKISQGPKAPDATVEEMPPWFGGDEDQWKHFSAFIGQKIDKVKADARAEVIKEIMTKGSEEQKAIDEATKYMNNEIAKIESDKQLNPNGEKIDKNRLFKIAEEFELVDTKGRWNWKAAYQFYKNQQTKKASGNIQDKKNFAGATISDKKSETKPSEFKTADDFSNPSNRPW